jgi:hypothetical protein
MEENRRTLFLLGSSSNVRSGGKLLPLLHAGRGAPVLVAHSPPSCNSSNDAKVAVREIPVGKDCGGTEPVVAETGCIKFVGADTEFLVEEDAP